LLWPSYGKSVFWLQEVKQKFTLREAASDNIMDKWILSFTNSLIASVHQEMSAYHLYAVVSLLTK
jgi:isoleucyl-tRNA synthetase